MMRAPTPSEPKSTFPTYQVPQESAMRGSAPPLVQDDEKTDDEKHNNIKINNNNNNVELVDWATWKYRAELPSEPKNLTATTTNNSNNNNINNMDNNKIKNNLENLLVDNDNDDVVVEISGSSSCFTSVINGSSCILLNKKYNNGNSNIRMQSVTENCLLNSVTVPKIQRNDQNLMVAHNNYNNNNNIIRNNYNNNNNSSDKLVYKFGALPLFNGRDIPYKKSDDLNKNYVVLDLNNALINKNNILMQMMQKNMKNLTNNNNNITNDEHINDNDTISDNNYNDTIIVENKDDYYLNNMTKIDDDEEEEGRTTITYYSTPLRLRGGGESSLSTGTSGWGTPPSQQASNNNANNSSGWGSANPANPNNTGTQQWNNANRPPTNNQGPTSQDANKTNANGQPATSQSTTSGWGQPPGTKPTTGNNVPPTSTTTSVANPQNNNNNNNVQNNTSNTTKQQLEQLNNMREAIFSQDGWGGQHVNQDTNWDIPGSPEPPMKMDGSGGPPPWKPAVNNGTELWEANLRNGGQPPPQPQQKTPWGHTPSTNIGGTWGEDDDTDSSNVWTGVPSGQQQWGANAGNNGAAMWGGAKKENDWGTGGGNAGWGDPRAADPRTTGMDPREIRPDLRDMRTGNTDPMRMIDPREQMRQMANTGDMRGDPRGITGRLNGAGAEAFWGQAAPHASAQHMHHQNKMGVGGPGNSAGWEEPSPPSQRRNMPNYDDGTSLWGNPQQGAGGMGGGGGRGGNSVGGGPPGMPQSRMKPDVVGAGAAGGGVGGGGAGGNAGGGGGAGGGVWGHGRNGSWDEVPGGAGSAGNAGGVSVAGGSGGGGWGEETGPWPKQKMNSAPLWDNELDWGGPKPGPKQQLTKEMVWNSKQFRMLVDMGHKKEDVENALRMRDMNLDAALDLLSPMQNQDGWRTSAANRHEDHYDHSQFPSQRFPSGPTGGGGQMSFQPGNNAPNLLNNMNTSGTGGNNSLINSISPAVVQKMLTQGGSSGYSAAAAAAAASSAAAAAAAGRSLQPQTQQPSTQQLRMLVQQIQMAVQAGYLNHQILNQPLAPQTLVLLNQLLQQIKALQLQLANQQSITQTKLMNGQPPNAAFLHGSVLITKTKQTITNLQNQIAAQQAIYVKQQQHQGSMGGTSDLFKQTQMHDSLNALQSNFADLGINKDPQVMNQQSRLNQWINKDKEDGSEFSRAPGSASKPLATSPNMNQLGLTQPDGPWSSGRTGDTGWPDSGAGDTANDMKDTQWSTPAQPSLTDLVPEFEPGKPWKGNQLKSIEDDPSITPGSVVRSPLSIPTIKDNNELFNPSKSPPVTDTTMQSMSLNTLSSSTWSFNPPSSSTTSAFTSPQSKLPTTKGGGGGGGVVQGGPGGGGGLVGDLNPTTAVTAELWGAPKLRGPPPGLSAKSGAVSGNGGVGGGTGGANSLVNGWSSNLSTASWGGQRSSGSWGGSTSPWLLLRNLTAQIDGSTLRTLCMQHGPLLSFHLYLHQGFALAKYSSQQEATKAQTALNNCVLGNTTILAENPTDWDATALLQQVANQPSSSGPWRGSTKQPGTTDTWSTGWPNNPTTASLWATPTLDTGDQARATPSSLNSFLPNDLLGGESM